jgi:hypothetical protein
LAAGGGFDKEPLHTPEDAEERGKHEVGGIEKKDGPLAGLGFS